MTKTYYMKIGLRGALVNWKDCSWQGCCHTDDGRLRSPAAVKAVFLDELALGDRFYQWARVRPKSGCPGHDAA